MKQKRAHTIEPECACGRNWIILYGKKNFHLILSCVYDNLKDERK